MEPNINQPVSQENSTGPVIAIIIVLFMIILGGFYFWGERSRGREMNVDGVVSEQDLNELSTIIETQSTSDETSSIEEDLNATEVDSLDQELQSL